MRTAMTIAEVRAAVRDARTSGARVGFVPTMGFLHEGHLRLVDEARRRAPFVVMSIFVNPLQFGPGEDLARYPRDPAGDADKARQRRVDLLFTPDGAEIYPTARPMVSVVCGAIAARWEGASRPGHFSGVLTVVAKLLNIVQPDVVIFGQKDIQQATVVKAMVRDLDFPVAIVVAPTVREPDGLAMSSRNSYLSAPDRSRALALSAALRAAEDAYRRGERRSAELEAAARERLSHEPEVRVDYLAVIHPDTLEPVEQVADGTIVALAARVGPTRLIDNVILGRA